MTVPVCPFKSQMTLTFVTLYGCDLGWGHLLSHERWPMPRDLRESCLVFTIISDANYNRLELSHDILFASWCIDIKQSNASKFCALSTSNIVPLKKVLNPLAAAEEQLKYKRAWCIWRLQHRECECVWPSSYSLTKPRQSRVHVNLFLGNILDKTKVRKQFFAYFWTFSALRRHNFSHES